MRARRSAWARCPTASRSRSNASSKSAPAPRRGRQRSRRRRKLAARPALRFLSAFLLLCCGSALAQSWGPRALEELKQETVRRAERNLNPIGGIKAEDAREA